MVKIINCGFRAVPNPLKSTVIFLPACYLSLIYNVLQQEKLSRGVAWTLRNLVLKIRTLDNMPVKFSVLHINLTLSCTRVVSTESVFNCRENVCVKIQTS